MLMTMTTIMTKLVKVECLLILMYNKLHKYDVLLKVSYLPVIPNPISIIPKYVASFPA